MSPDFYSLREMRWNFDPETKELFLKDGPKKIKIINIEFLAQHLAKDHCIVQGANGLEFAKIAETPTDKVLSLPDADIALVEMAEPFRGGKFLIFTPTAETTEMLKDIMCKM
jgi:hypothetical protein